MIREVLTIEQLTAMPPEEAAALWLIREDAGDDVADDALFNAWLDSNVGNATIWARARRIWECFEDNAEAGNPSQLRASPVRSRFAIGTTWRLALAASFVGMIGGGALLVASHPRWITGGPSEQIIMAGTDATAPSILLHTAKGERRQVALADGTLVMLNTDTSLRVRFSPAKRQVELLTGQAFFQVSHNKERPFIVVAGQRSVTAVGTAFEVLADTTSFRVVLVEGRVAVVADGAGNSAPIMLRAGQQLLARTAAPVLVSNADLPAVDDWRHGVVNFQGTTLADAAREMNRYSGDQLVVRDNAIANLKLTGVFSTDDGARFARTIAQIYPVRVVDLGKGKREIVGLNSRR